MNEAFRAALRVHIQNTSLYEPKSQQNGHCLIQALGTVLVMLAAMGLIVAIGMS